MIWKGLLAMVFMATAAVAAPEVATKMGPVTGQSQDGVDSFLGIPYAAPPIGDLRWMPPQPMVPWTAPRAAIAYGPDCAQLPDPSDAAPTGTTPSEDCLYLNVWRPTTGGENLPVLIWIYGGGYVNGGASPPVYDGSALASKGMVVVSLNYRLGRFGFFAHPALQGETGNFAFLDMLAALRWVKGNIGAFGGDPGHATIWGESAGGDAVLHLMAMPQAQGLFQQAVVMSGGGRKPLLGGATQDQAEQAGLRFAASQGITGTGAEALAALRALPAQALIGQLNMMGLLNQTERATYAMGPIADGGLFVEMPGIRLSRAETPAMPLMIGSTGDDVPVQLPPLDDPFALFGPNRGAAMTAYQAAGFPDAKALIFAIGADQTMHEPARRLARIFAAKGAPSWLYRFDYVPSPQQGEWRAAPHASELPYFFGTLDKRFPAGLSETDRAVMGRQMEYLANFVRQGDPNPRNTKEWLPVDPKTESIMVFDTEGAAMTTKDPLALRLNLIETANDPGTGGSNDGN